MRPLLITDGAYLKGTYKGTNLVLVGMDGNNQIIPIATGVSQGETGESWTWFLLKLKECIGEVPNLAIITDRHLAIMLACNTVFPNAFHGYCYLTVNTLSDWATHKVMDRMQKSANWKVHEIEYGKLYQVDDRRRVHKVDLTTRSCTCRKWQLSGIPCGHVIAVGRAMRCTDCSELALCWFRKTKLYSTYQELVYPVGEPLTWQCPDGLQTRKESNIHINLDGHSQEYGATYTNNYVRSQEYEAAYISNNYVRSQEYEAAYTNNYVRSQEYRAAYNSMGSQEYGATYNSMDVRSQDPNPTMSNLFSQFNLGKSSQQTYSTWDHVNKADP
ncbi:transposase, MuDR, MULE transposase domain protein [Tanacetum coccineum]